jgi:hypothetical protein
MTDNLSDTLQHLQGQIDALTHLCAALAATASPTAAHIVLLQVERVAATARESGSPSAYITGYTSISPTILAALETAAQAEQMRGLSTGEKH